MRPSGNNIDSSGATDNQGLIFDAASDLWLPRDVVLGLTGTSGAVTITDNGDGTWDLDVAALPAGGATAETLAKTSGTDYDADWVTGSVPVILLPAGSDATDVPAGTPVGTIVMILA